MRVRVGVDVGGTKVEAVVLSEDGAERGRVRRSTPRGDYEATVETIAGAVAEVEAAAGARGSVGIGIPGTESHRTGLIKNANSTWLIGRPLRTDLERRLGRPVRLANDANCFALSEATDGAAATGRVVFGVILGTGTGAGLVVNGRVWAGPNGIAGEWGHNPLPAPRDDERPGPPCYCGRHGCIETFLSGPGLAADYARRALRPTQEPTSVLTAQDVVRRAGEGDQVAEDALQRYLNRLARALASVVNVLDPDVIVVGGGVSHIRAIYERVPVLWRPHVFSDEVATSLVPARFGDASGVRGAAWLWER